MLGVGMGELLMIFVVALIAIGPEKLPKVARQLAQLLGQFRQASDDLKQSILLANPLDDQPAVSTPKIVSGVVVRDEGHDHG